MRGRTSAEPRSRRPPDRRRTAVARCRFLKGCPVLSLVLPKGSLEKQVLELFDAADLTRHPRRLTATTTPASTTPGSTACCFLRPQEIPTLRRAGHLRPRHLRPRLDRARPARTSSSLGEIGGGRRTARPRSRSSSPCRGIRLGRRSRDLPDGVRISTEMPETTRRFCAEHGVNARMSTSHGATEAKIPDIVDAIVDLTETGSSLRKARAQDHRDAAHQPDRAARQPRRRTTTPTSARRWTTSLLLVQGAIWSPAGGCC